MKSLVITSTCSTTPECFNVLDTASKLNCFNVFFVSLTSSHLESFGIENPILLWLWTKTLVTETFPFWYFKWRIYIAWTAWCDKHVCFVCYFVHCFSYDAPSSRPVSLLAAQLPFSRDCSYFEFGKLFFYRYHVEYLYFGRRFMEHWCLSLQSFERIRLWQITVSILLWWLVQFYLIFFRYD